MEPNVKIGVAWYTPEDWKAVKQMSEDGDKLHDSYQEWLLDARRREKTLRNEGHEAERVLIDPAKLKAWCMLRGARIDASARSKFVSEFLQSRGAGGTSR